MQTQSKNIQTMFNTIAHRYDFLNRLLSMRRDVAWRKKAIRLSAMEEGHLVLDLACGTGDMVAEILRQTAGVQVIGGDFSMNMLEVARKKLPEEMLSATDAHALPFKDAVFDRMTIAFGFRNVTDKPLGLSEMFRVLKPGGRLCILEFSQPEGKVFGALYKWYFTKVLPLIGGLVSGSRSAYAYLPDSVYKFPKKDAYRQMLKEAGFAEVRFNPMTFGICDATICEKSR